MIGAEIVIGVIIGVLFEVTSNTEGTPSEQGSDSNPGKVKTAVRTIELAIAAASRTFSTHRGNRQFFEGRGSQGRVNTTETISNPL
jgi:hypothetical protein